MVRKLPRAEDRAGRSARMAFLIGLSMASIGCAQRGPGWLRPPGPRPERSSKEPGLSVRAPFVDVQIADEEGESTTDELARKPSTLPSRVDGTR